MSQAGSTERIATARYEPVRTGDGSPTLRNIDTGVLYHSRFGAVQESMHVFIRSGLARAQRAPVRILEVGMGTGLNMLLSWIRCLEGKCSVEYTGLEPFPLDAGTLRTLAYCEDLGWPGLEGAYLEMMTSDTEQWVEVEGNFRFRRSEQSMIAFPAHADQDLIYFDAFGPGAQPDMWTGDVFEHMFKALAPGGTLVTYCAQGAVRRTMIQCGFTVERLPGPPGKREMLRATKPGHA